MARIELATTIRAPVEGVFDLSRSVDLHLASTAQTGERAVGSIRTGLLTLGQEVTWRAKHFGVWQELTSRITAYDRPRHFRDSMVKGVFARFDHDHFFEPIGGGTLMRDVFDYDAPWGLLGRLAESCVLTRHLRKLLLKRNELIRQTAESEGFLR